MRAVDTVRLILNVAFIYFYERFRDTRSTLNKSNSANHSIVSAAFIMGEDSAAQRINLEHWMRELPAQLKDVPLIYLAIPGKITCYPPCL